MFEIVPKKAKKVSFSRQKCPKILFEILRKIFSAKIQIGNFLQIETFLKDFQTQCISKVGTLVFRNQPKMHEELKKFAKNGNDESSVS